MTMVQLDLLPNKPIWAYTSDKPISVSRIGEIILIPNDTLNIHVDKVFEARNPWRYFGTGNRYDFTYGLYAKQSYGLLGSADSVVQISINKIDINRTARISSYIESLSLALIQIGSDDIFRAAICTGATLRGVETFDTEYNLAFTIPNCNMLYNK